MMRTLMITEKQSGQRLDKYLKKYLPQAPQGLIYKMLRKKNIVLNGKKAAGSEKLCENDEIRLYLSEETLRTFGREPERRFCADLDILYENRHILVINKPSGMLSQKSRPSDVSLNEYVAGYLLQSGQLTEEDLLSFRPGICNRLDRNTSGLVLAGKTVTGLQRMAELFRSRTVKKEYLCLAAGRITKGARISGYLHKDEKCNKVELYGSPEQGAACIETAYEPLCPGDTVTLLKVDLITGKTHQIRSHLAAIGHPVAGDPKYGDDTLNRRFSRQYGLDSQLLHAWRLTFPAMEAPFEDLGGRTVTAPLPETFRRIVMDCLCPADRRVMEILTEGERNREECRKV